MISIGEKKQYYKCFNLQNEFLDDKLFDTLKVYYYQN